MAAAAIAVAAFAMVQPSGALAGTTANAQTGDTPVIVVMKDPATTPAARKPLAQKLSAAHAKHVKSFSLVNATAATVSKAEAAQLAADPTVASVVPDSKLNKKPKLLTDPAGPRATGPSSTKSLCPPAGKTQLEPEALEVTSSDSNDPSAKTARSLGFTGKGVKVAYIADGTDVNNPDFIRADGSHVFTDYKDFTGEGAISEGPNNEAALDASSIAAQGLVRHAITTQPAGCDIRVEGVAPGASLVGLRVFPDEAFATTSALVEAIDYAVTVAHVDVLNESFGYDPFPDTNSQDVVKLFNDKAVAAGVTVTASSGDAGTTGTLGSPSTDPQVISAGASTTFRVYAQQDRFGFKEFGATGFTSNNISSLSSGGINQNAGTMNIVAPGDLNWVACDADEGCAQGLGVSGGTSESAPLTAGTAALVIEAYQSTHHGAKPSPALIKQIITSTADDLGHPAYEQGAGMLDSYKAVQAALSANGGKPTGSTLLVDHSQLTTTAPAGSPASWHIKVTNNGATTQTVHLNARQLGNAENKQDATVTIGDSVGGHTPVYNFQKIPVKVPAGADRLDAAIAYQSNNGATVRVALIDPNGNYSAYSLPQGLGNYGHVDVRNPAAGTWSAFVFQVNSANGGTGGTAHFEATTERYHGFGSVSPSTLTLKPGRSADVQLSARTLSQPGDENASLVLNAGAGSQTSIPVILRSLVGGGSGAFNGVLTGGNGRQSDVGESRYFQFDVRPGTRDIDASVALTNDPGDEAILYLIDPDGQTQGFGTNRIATAYDQSTGQASVTPGLAATLNHRAPKPGRWTLGVNFAGPIVGDEVSQPFHGNVQFNKVDVSASGLPHGGTLKAGTPVTVKVKVHNTSAAPANFFIDPRLTQKVDLPLDPVQNATNVALPLGGDKPVPTWLVPTETDRVSVRATGSEPILFDFGPIGGDPDTLSSTGTTAEGSFSRNPVTAGLWGANPVIAGANGPTAPPPGTADLTMTARTRAFDPAITSPAASDLWQQSAKVTGPLRILTVQPGQTQEIPVTITPSGTPGTVVSGTAFVDSLIVGDMQAWTAFNFALPSDLDSSLPFVATGNELAGFDYTYKIG